MPKEAARLGNLSPPMARRIFTRRQVFFFAGAIALVGGARHTTHRIARSAKASGPLSDEAKQLIAKAWEGLDPKKVLDTHVHIVGTGDSGSGCFVGPRMQTLTNPMDYLKFTLYEEASGVSDSKRVDEEYLSTLTGLISSQSPHGRLLIFAFDQFHGDDGKPVKSESEFYTPNDYVLKIAKAHPELFVPAASVHPYREDAVAELERCVAQGAAAVKWLPNAMNIDPSSAKCDPFYEAMARLKIPLISHAGEEKAVHAEERQRLGNPLHLRRPLEHGVTVVIAHCASLGDNPDLDSPKAPDGGEQWTDNFDLFLRLMSEKQWEGRLFGDVSALTIVNRIGAPLVKVLKDPELQKRLVNGSDYPLPAINVLMQTRAVENHALITAEQRELLNEIDRHDPLLLDFVMKRIIRLHEDGKEYRLADEVFTARPEVFPTLV
jgi:mannonate dehydratase